MKQGGLIMYGTVTKYFQDKGFGFIRGNDGNSYFIHHSNLGGEYLEQGYYVFFRTFQNDRSEYNAGNVIVVEAAERRRGKRGNTHK